MIDAKEKLYPDINKMIRTCKREIPKEQDDLFFEHFPELYEMMKRGRHITEEVHDRFGVEKDTHFRNNIIDKSDGITRNSSPCQNIKVRICFLCTYNITNTITNYIIIYIYLHHQYSTPSPTSYASPIHIQTLTHHQRKHH